MELLEVRHGRDIETILVDAYRQHRNMRDAGAAIGITHAAFSLWIFRLGIELPKKVEKPA